MKIHYFRLAILLGFLVMLIKLPIGYTGDHGGTTVQEHAGKEVHDYTEKDIKKAIRKHVRNVSKKQVMTLEDEDDKGKVLRLKFIKIHDPVRKLKDNRFFACTDFQVAGVKEEKLYDIDFWLKPGKSDKLIVYNTKVHKHPVRKKGEWVKKARYTFSGEKMVPVPE